MLVAFGSQKDVQVVIYYIPIEVAEGFGFPPNTSVHSNVSKMLFGF